MGTILSAAVLIGLTLVFAWWHVRRTEGARGAGAAVRRCPRCSAQISSEDRRCPECRVPLQAFEVINAELAEETQVEGDLPPHAVVRTDVCVGCSTCVDACPEEGALKMVGKLAVVDLSLCKGHGDCVDACPVAGIVVTTGAAVQRVEVPLVDGNFESNIPGVYIVGELGGRGLIKNAINEGRIAAEHATAALALENAPGEAGMVDLAIVGSGPAGLSAGLEALAQGLRYVILEQGSLADSIRKYPRHKLLLAEPISVPLYGQLWVADASKESLLQVWETIIESTGLVVETGRRVESVERRDGYFELGVGEEKVTARRVILAMGRRGTPRRLGVPGEELGKVLYDIIEMEAFQGRRVIVVGGGDSAVESALGLANQPDTEVRLSYRGDAFKRVKERNRTKMDQAVADGRILLELSTQLGEIRESEVDLLSDGDVRTLPNDDVIIRIGGEPPSSFLEKVGISVVKKDVPLPDAPGQGEPEGQLA